jgi:hypothetical protein
MKSNILTADVLFVLQDKQQGPEAFFINGETRVVENDEYRDIIASGDFIIVNQVYNINTKHISNVGLNYVLVGSYEIPIKMSEYLWVNSFCGN